MAYIPCVVQVVGRWLLPSPENLLAPLKYLSLAEIYHHSNNIWLSDLCRSYYRCTDASCNVKKRVERSHTDPTVVMTTYEGQHTHPSPLLVPRHSGLIRSHREYSSFPGRGMTDLSMELDAFQGGSHHGRGPYYGSTGDSNLPPLMGSGEGLLGSTSAAVLGNRRFCPPGSFAMAGFSVGDEGLLQDVVASRVPKEEF